MTPPPVLDPPAPDLDAPGPPPARPPRDGGDGRGGGEGGAGDTPRRPGRSVAVLGMWVALVPMAMLFLAFVSAYVVRHTMGTQWTPGAVPGILWLNTAILFASSALLERARGVLRSGRPVRPWLGATLAGGLLFVGGQLVAWQELRAAGYGFSATPHSSFFYMMTGAHAVHVAGGLLGLGIATAWPAASPRRGVALQVLAIYWHFLAVLWLGLFALLGLWR